MPQHRNAQSFTPGDPRAIAAGRTGGKARRLIARSADYITGYRAGARNARRHLDRWIQEQHMAFEPPSPFIATAKRLHAAQLAATTADERHAADEAFAHFFRMTGAGRFDEWVASHPEHNGGDVDDSLAANPEDASW